MNQQTATDGTVGKALQLLDIVVGFGRDVRFSEILEVSPFPKATMYRLLQTLTNQGLLSIDKERHTYSPGMRLVRIGRHAWNQSSLAPLAEPFLETLADDVNETVHLAQMERGSVVFIDKKIPENGFQTMAVAGRRSPAHCTGVGKAMLAFMDDETLNRALAQQTFEGFTPSTHTGPETLFPELEEIRALGVAFDRQEHEQGMNSIAAPIFGANNRVIGALSIVTSTRRMPPEEMDKYRPALSRTATQIGDQAALWPFPIAE